MWSSRRRVSLFVGLVALFVSALGIAQTGPGQPQVGTPTLFPTTVSFPVTWTASTAPYTWRAGYNDGSSNPNNFSGSASGNSTTITMAYHFDGLASSAFICIADPNTIPPSLGTCNSFNVPAKPGASKSATLQWKSGDGCTLPGQSCSFSIWRCSPIGCTNFAQIGSTPQVGVGVTQTFTDTPAPTPSAVYKVRDDCPGCSGNSNFTNTAAIAFVPNPPTNLHVALNTPSGNPIFPDPDYPITQISRIPAISHNSTGLDGATAAHGLYFYRQLWNVDRSFMLINHEGPSTNNTISLHDGLGNWIKDLFVTDPNSGTGYDWRLTWSASKPNILYTNKLGTNSIAVWDVTLGSVIQLFDTTGLATANPPSSVQLTPSGPTASATRIYFSVLSTLNAPPFSNISNVVNNGSGLIRVTSTGHGIKQGETVQIDSVTGTTEANGTWIVNVIDANTVDLQASTFTNAYVSAGRMMWYDKHFSFGLNADGTINSGDKRQWSSRWPESWRLGTGIKGTDTGKNRKTVFADWYWTAGNQEVISGFLQAGSTSTQLHLNAAALAVDHVYEGNTLYVSDFPDNEQTITNYVGSTQTATISPGLPGAPTGTTIMINEMIVPYQDINVTVTGAVSGTGGVVRLTATGHGLTTGDVITVNNVGGTTEANGVWPITVINVNTLELVGSAFAHAYTSGGTLNGRIPTFHRGISAGHASVTSGGKIITGHTAQGSYRPFKITARDLPTGANKKTIYSSGGDGSSTRGAIVQEFHITTPDNNANRVFVGPFPGNGSYPYPGPGTYVPNVGGAWNSPNTETNVWVPYDEVIMLSTADSWATSAGVTVRYVARSYTHGSGGGSPFSFWSEPLPTTDPLGQRVEIQSLRTSIIEPWILFPDGKP